MAVISGHAQVETGDYAWAQQPLTEIFFVLLTAVIIPVAAVRLLRRLRMMARRPLRPQPEGGEA